MMSEEKARREFDKIANWVNAEEDKIMAELRKNGKFKGLDTNREAFEPIHRERDRMLEELKKKMKAD